MALWGSSSAVGKQLHCSVFRSEPMLRPQPNLLTSCYQWFGVRRSWIAQVQTTREHQCPAEWKTRTTKSISHDPFTFPFHFQVAPNSKFNHSTVVTSLLE